MVGIDGETFEDVEDYLTYLMKHLPAAYRAGRDYRWYEDAIRKVASGETDASAASRTMPELRRVGGVCPCSKSVRWIVDGNGNGNGNGAG